MNEEHILLVTVQNPHPNSWENKLMCPLQSFSICCCFIVNADDNLLVHADGINYLRRCLSDLRNKGQELYFPCDSGETEAVDKITCSSWYSSK